MRSVRSRVAIRFARLLTVIIAVLVLLLGPEFASAHSLASADQDDPLSADLDFLKISAAVKEKHQSQRNVTGSRPTSTRRPTTTTTEAQSSSRTSSRPPSSPNTNSTASNKRPGLITRTTDAIYKVLTGYFSHDDDEEEPDNQEYGNKLTTTKAPTSTRRPTTTSRAAEGTTEFVLHPTSTTSTTRPPTTSSQPTPTRPTQMSTSKTSQPPAVTLGGKTVRNATTMMTTANTPKSVPPEAPTYAPVRPSKSPTMSTNEPRASRTSKMLATTVETFALPVTATTMLPRWPSLPATRMVPTMSPRASLPPHFQLNYSDVNYDILPVSQPRTTSKPGGRTISPGRSSSHAALTFTTKGAEAAPIKTTTHLPETTGPTTTTPKPTTTPVPRTTKTITTTTRTPTTTTTAASTTTLRRTAMPQTTRPITPPTPTPTTSTPTRTAAATAAAATTTTMIPSSQHSTTSDVKHFEETRQNSTSSTFSSSVHLFSLLSRAFTSISGELTFLNRTTRLAHDKLESTDEPDPSPSNAEREIESTKMDSDSNSSALDGENKLLQTNDRLSNLRRSTGTPEETEPVNQRQQVSSREDILLLCKLLHKHLEQSSGNSTSANSTLNHSLNLHTIAENLGQLTGSTERPPSNATAQPARQIAEASNVVDQRWLLREPRAELSELSHGDRLLESVFELEGRASVSLDKLDTNRKEQPPYEEAALRLLSELYNMGHARRVSGTPASSISLDESEGSSSLPTKNISLVLWSKTMTEGRGGRLKLVYWLLERLSHSPNQTAAKFRVLELAEANELLDQLNHLLLQQAINEVGLVRPKGVLVAVYKREPESSLEPPRVIDDSLQTSRAGSGDGKTPSTLQLLIDRFSQASFGENFHLYLILFVVILFVIILCVAIPALCCKCMMPTSSPTLTKAASPGKAHRGGRNGGVRRNFRNNGTRSAVAERTERPRTGFYRSTDPLRESITSVSGALEASRDNGGGLSDAAKSGEAPTIWRKLSNSTTTMTKNEIRTLEDDGELEFMGGGIEDGGQHAKPTGKASDRAKFEWYTFEDNKEQTIRRRLGPTPGLDSSMNIGTRLDKPTQTMVVRDQCKVTKSVQTYARGDEDSERSHWGANESLDPEDGVRRDEHLSLAYRDRLETRNSNTLTKSELVMLKEKLIPIGQKLGEEQDRKRQHVVVDHDYVNTATGQQQQQRPSGQQQVIAKPPSRHIDSSSVESTNGQARERITGPHDGSPLSGGEHTGRRSNEDGTVDSQRAPSMRYLELPSHTKSKVDAIKSELDKLEARDSVTSARPRQAKTYSPSQDSVGTYKRYDVI